VTLVLLRTWADLDDAGPRAREAEELRPVHEPTPEGETEARRGGEFLGYEGMTHLAQQALALGSLEEMSQAVVEGARSFGGGFRDDVCVLLARRL
jgi:hypothetical protein